ncbi:MAG: protein-disulfide reductase DsbD family protein [Spongiibacter marinus]|uniref:protein-disulfide reductase DsbD family protein n=1 Tax=Spongiibacter TaxID=630749 RepID=UPI000C0A542C|nr:protein-disulfide reductase DsbD [Spongiibacter sp.]MAK43189.1 disulfide bond formation protein DsbD [Spongiibacter sp.]
MNRFLLLFCIVSASFFSYASDPFSPSSNTDLSANGFAQGAQFLPVEQAYKASVSGDGGLRIDWQIAEGYYLYRERFSVSLSRQGQPVDATVEFSPGKVKDDPYFGKTEVYYHGTTLQLDVADTANLQLTVVSQGCADAGLCYPPRSQTFSSDAQGVFTEVDTAASTPAALTAPAENRGLLITLILAAIGGAILNLMPCVFPVLGLKVLSFSNAHQGSPASHGLIYSAGVVLSFVLVAALLITLQNAGQAIGWGFQLQSPLFVSLLASLFFVLSLNLLGLFELGGKWMNVGADISREPGYRGSFFTGVLATLVASPCTAPFMGSAIGYAASQPPGVALLVFASLGAGMAAPVLLLTLFPQWLKLLPKPGDWMLHLRQFMAFPLLATAIWLAWVVGRQNGADAMAATLITWLLLGFGIWLWPLGKRGKALAAITALAIPLLLHSGLQRPAPASSQTGFDRSQIQSLRESGRNVFLDVTADWCITCAANEALVLNTDDIRDAFERANVSYVVADWTRYDPVITELLADFQRNGIPLYIYYPADLSQPPKVLPQILSKDTVMAILHP